MKYTVEIVTKITLEVDAANTGAASKKPARCIGNMIRMNRTSE